MMRGTVWTIYDDVPIKREVVTVDADNAFDFEVEVSRQKYLKPAPEPGSQLGYLEFGPIAPPWGKL